MYGYYLYNIVVIRLIGLDLGVMLVVR